MSFTDVTNQLRSRGLKVDLIAWYPFRLKDGLGIDSCGVFYVGGGASVKLQYSMDDIELLSDPRYDGPRKLTTYKDNRKPGQKWTSYFPKGKGLAALLQGLLEPTCTEAQLKVESAVAENESVYCPYIRFKQKHAEKLEEAWLFDGEMHNGSHYPLAAFTHNACRRSPTKWSERHEKKANQ